MLATLQAGAGPDLLVLHSATPHLLVDIPDVPALLDAYSSAPAMQLAADTEAREAFGKMEQRLGVNMASSLSGALQLLGLESSAGTEDIADLARRVQRVTFSYATAEVTSGELAAEFARLREAQIEALDIEEHLETRGEVELEERLRSDPWGRPYEVSYSPEGTPRALSRGADGRPGGEGSAVDVGPEFDPAGWLEQERDRRRSILINLEFVSEDVARDSWAAMKADLGVETIGLEEPRLLLGAAGTLERVAVARMDGTTGWSWHADRRVIVSLGAISVESVEARALSAGASFAAEPSWVALHTLALPSGGETVIRGALDTEWLASLVSDTIDLLPLGEQEVVFSTARPTAFRMQLIGGRFHTDMVRPPASDTSWLRAFGNAAPTQALREAIPADAAGAMVTHLDASQLERQFVRWAGLDGAGATRLAEMEQRLGFDLRRDVFGSLGTDVAMFVMPVNSIGLPNAVAIAELRDPLAFERGMQGLASAFEQAGMSTLSIRAARYREAPMWSFEMERDAQASLPIEISPTVAIVGSRVVFTTTILFAKREIKRLTSETPRADSASPLPEMPAGATMVGSMDWPTMIASLYTSLRGAAALAGSFADLPIDLGALTAGLPDRPETFTRFFAKTHMSGAPLGERFHVRMESSFGPETWLGLVGFVTSAMRSMRSPEAPPTPAEAPKSDSSAADSAVAVLELTRGTLDRLSTRLLVYQIDRGAYPATLEELTQPSPNYPDGYLDGEPVPMDGWGRRLGYLRGDDGSSYRLWSLGPDGVDASGDEVVP